VVVVVEVRGLGLDLDECLGAVVELRDPPLPRTLKPRASWEMDEGADCRLLVLTLGLLFLLLPWLMGEEGV